VLVRPELPGDVGAARAVHLAAFDRPELAGQPAVEAALLDALRAGGHLLADLTFVAVDGAEVVGHVAASRATVGGQPAVALGPVAVQPGRQGRGTGSALVEALLAAADRHGERAVVLLGDPAFYGRFGFRDSRLLGVTAPEPGWGEHFQVRPLGAWAGAPMSGAAAYAPPFDDV
jgi:putative acetyltransferase